MLARLIQSIRVSLVIAFSATILSAVFGTVLGFAAAKFRGWVEHLVLVIADFQAAPPFLIMSLAVLAFFGSSMLLIVCLMGFYGWERYARIARGLAISASAQGYASAVVQLGATSLRVYFRPIMPNVASTLIVSMTLTFPENILMESGLSFLGLGVQPPETSLGNMVGFVREYLTRAMDHARPGLRHHADDAVDLAGRRLAARQARPDSALTSLTPNTGPHS